MTSDWRLTHNPGAPEGVPELERYDRRTDPLSLEDVAGDHPEVVERLAEADRSVESLRQWTPATFRARASPRLVQSILLTERGPIP